ncbi:hypothetical protein AC249_AIPGENE2123 [Exaiptasia diaphana]|nr:hypothetical protein AC249_AIPGENE2123 [Exaiptasia diaphana]
MADALSEDEQSQDSPKYFIRDNVTMMSTKDGDVLVGDFTLKLRGELSPLPGSSSVGEEGAWIASCGHLVRGNFQTRIIVISARAFNSKTKLQETIRKKLGGAEEKAHQQHFFYKTDHLGHQYRNYWLLSNEQHIKDGKLLALDQRQVFLTEDSSACFSTMMSPSVISKGQLKAVCQRFIELSSSLCENRVPFLLASSFLMTRLLMTTMETIGESTLGVLFSFERNVGKTATLEILANGQGLPSRSHPLICSGGDQNMSGISVLCGRVLRFDYVKDQSFGARHESAFYELQDLVKEHKASDKLGIWVQGDADHFNIITKIKHVLECEIKGQQPRWYKGVLLVLFTYALFHSTAGEEFSLIEPIRKFATSVATHSKVQPFWERMQLAIQAKLDQDEEVKDELDKISDMGRKTISLPFAMSDATSLEEIKKKVKGKVHGAKAFRIPRSQLDLRLLAQIDYKCGATQLKPSERYHAMETEESGEPALSEENKKTLEKISSQIHELDGPSTSGITENETSDSRRPRRLFAEGTIGVLPVVQDNEDDLCHECKRTSPAPKNNKKRKKDIVWVECVKCKNWFHLDCSGLTALPKADEEWLCKSCENIEKSS